MPRGRDEPSFNLSNKVDVDGTLIALFLPSILITLACWPAGLWFYYDGGLVERVPGGASANFYYTMLIYTPIMCTLGVATTMVGAGRIVAKIWNPLADLSTIQVGDEQAEDGPSEAAPLQPIRRTFTRSPSRLLSRSPSSRRSIGAGGGEDSPPPSALGRWKVAFGMVAEQNATAKALAASKQNRAIRAVRRISRTEVLQWLLVFVFITSTLMVGNYSLPSRPLWDETMRPYLMGYAAMGTLGVVLLIFTVRNLKVSMVKREGEKTTEYCAALLGRIGFTLLFQHLCFFWVGICGTNMMPALQPLAWSIYISTQQEMEPCSLLTPSYYALNCTSALDLRNLGPLGTQVECTGESWEAYQTAFTACGAATSAIQMRNVGYSAFMINLNLLLYLILQECTRDMSAFALSKMARGITDARTSTIFTMTSIALVCVPIFIIYLLASPMMVLKPNVVFMLTCVTGFNILCWFIISLLLNLEFLVDMVRYQDQYDVFISYRVRTEAVLAKELSEALKTEARVYLDQDCLKTGENWEQGFVKGLGSSSVYTVLITDGGMKGLKAATSASDCDHLLLEMRLARELEMRRQESSGEQMFKILPVLLGPYGAGRDGCHPFDFEATGEAAFPETQIDAVEKKLLEMINMLSLSPSHRLSPPGVRNNVAWLMKRQGFVDDEKFGANISGEKKDAIIRAVTRKIMPVVKEVRALREKSGGGSCAELCAHLRNAMSGGKGKMPPRGGGAAVAPDNPTEHLGQPRPLPTPGSASGGDEQGAAQQPGRPPKPQVQEDKVDAFWPGDVEA